MELETDKRRDRSAFFRSAGVVLEIKVKEGQEGQSWQVILRSRRRGAPADEPRKPRTGRTHVGAARGAARVSVGDAAEGKTEEQALPPDRPQAASVAFRHAGATGQVAGTDRDPIPARRTFVAWRVKSE